MIWLLALSVSPAAEVIALWDLEGSDGGLVPGGETGAWEWGEVASGPGAGFVGTRAWATNLDGDYGNDSVETLGLPPHDLSALSTPTLCWAQWLDLEQGDAGWLEWFDGGTSVVVEPVYGYPDPAGFTGFTGVWETVCAALSGVAELGELRLVFSADDKVNASGWVVDEIALYDGDPVAPQVYDLSQVDDTEDLDGPYAVTVTVRDNQALDLVRLSWRLDGVDQTDVLMVPTATPDRWRGQLPGQDPGSDIAYWVEASDGENLTRLPATGARSFEVRLLAPTELAGPEGRVVADSAVLEWQAPPSIHTLTRYRVYREGAALLDVADPSAQVTLLGDGRDRFSVSALYDVGESEPSEPLTLDSHVPTVVALNPDQAFQGDTIRLDLLGEDLFFVQDELTLELGEGTQVRDVDVIDVDHARLLVAVDADAAPTLRDLTVVSGEHTAWLLDAFQVVDGGERPHLLSVTPAFATQGSQESLVIVASSPFAALPQVDLGEGVVVSEVAWLEDDELRVQVAVELGAPLGQHDLSIDDGERLYGGLTVQIRDDPPATTRCSTAGPHQGQGGAVALLALVGLRRRRRH